MPTMSETTLNENLVHEVGECQVCHRNVQHKRLTIKFLFQDAMAHIFNLERGFLFNFIELYRNPKTVMDNFISGDRYRHINPFRFLFTASALYAIVISFFGFSITEFMDVSSDQELREMQAFLGQYSDLMILANVPLIAFGTWLAFKYTGLNYAEHLVVNAYAYSLMTLSQIPFEVIFSAFLPSLDPYWEMATSIFFLLIFYVYIHTFSKSVFWGILRTIRAFVITGAIVLAVTLPGGIIFAMLKQ